MSSFFRFILFAIAIQIAVAPAFTAAEPFPSDRLQGDPASGEQKIGICKVCHGTDGISTNPAYPNLAGQYFNYLLKQISDFKSGMRKDPMMSAMIQSAGGDQDLRDIAAYYSSLDRMQSSKWFPDRDGKAIYESANKGCIACHGPEGNGFESEFGDVPAIAGQHKDYLVKQLKSFRSATRYNDPDGVMVKAASLLTEQEIEKVADYVSGL